MDTKKDLKEILGAAAVFVSLVVGAGFASGRELYTFFARFGNIGYVGFIIACGIMALCGYAVMDITIRLKLKNYGEFMAAVLGKRFGGIMLIVVNIFIGLMMAAMFSGFGAALHEASGLNYTAGVSIITALCFIVFLFDLKGIMGISAFLTPILLIGGIFLGIYTTVTGYAPVFLSFAGLNKSFVWTAAVYASYNLITAVSVLSSLGASIKSRKTARRTALVSGAALILLGLCFLIPISLNADALEHISMPMLALAANGGAVVEAVYITVIFAAIFTTAVSSGFAVIEWLANTRLIQKYNIPKTSLKALVSLSGLIFAHFGFNAFIDLVYPLFGCIGLFEVAVIIIYCAVGRKEK